VLVPIDFSATADRALEYAIALAQQLHARLTLLHVFDLTPLAMGDPATGVPVTALDTLETEAQQLLQASLERVQHAGLQGDSLLGQGTPHRQLWTRRASRGWI
jgi:nucleotide-binding universal stress UspA family protein